MTIALTDGRGELYQWDTGRTLTVDDATVTQVHFQNRAYGRTIDVDVKDGSAIIPDELLQKAGNLQVYAFAGTAASGFTKVERVYNIVRRNKPNDYMYTPTEQKSLEGLQNQIGDLNDLETSAKDNLVAAINEAAQSGGANIPVATPTLLGGVKPIAKTTDMTQDVGIDSEGKLYTKAGGGGADISLGVTATVGQTIKVKSVDDSGKPTAWEAVDMASGGSGETWELINTSVVPAETTKLTITQDLAGKPFAYYELKYVIQVAVPSDKQDATIWFSCQPQTARNASVKINGATTNQAIVGYASSLGGFAGGGNSLTIQPDVFSYGFGDTVSISKLTMFQMYASSASLHLPEGTKVSLFGRGK